LRAGGLGRVEEGDGASRFFSALSVLRAAHRSAPQPSAASVFNVAVFMKNTKEADGMIH